jgi:hypothetical protein
MQKGNAQIIELSSHLTNQAKKANRRSEIIKMRAAINVVKD